MNNRKKIILGFMVLGIVALSLLFVPFGDVALSSWVLTSEQQDPVTLYITTASGDAGWNQVMNEVKTRFEKENKDINVVFNDGNSYSSLYDESLRILDSMGKFGDIIEVRNWTFLAKDRLGALPESFHDVVSETYDQDGKIYGLRMSKNTVGMLYNRQLFQNLGLEEPTTYSDFLQVCETLKQAGYTPISLGGGDLWHLQFLLDSYYYKDVLLQDESWDEKLRTGAASWRDEAVVHMLTDLKELLDKGYIESSWSVDSDSMMASKMASGTVGMTCSGPWIFMPILNLDPDIQLGWFYIPDENGAVIARDSGTNYWTISKECEEDPQKYEAAIKFLEFLYSPDIDRYMCREMGNISTAVQQNEYDLLPIQQECRDDFTNASLSTTKGINDVWMPDGFRQHALSLFKEYMMGSTTVDQTTLLLQEAYEKCLHGE